MNPWTTALKYMIGVVLVIISSFFLGSARLWIFLGASVQIGMFAQSIYLHRTLAHRGIKMKKPLAFIFRFILWFLSGIKPKEWVAVHRKHHNFTDKQGDPHSPLVDRDGNPYDPSITGYFKIMFDFAFHYTREAQVSDTLEKYASDIKTYRLDGHAQKLWFMYGGALISIIHFIYWGNFTLTSIILSALFGATVMTAQGTLFVLLSSTINALTHVWGTKPYKSTPAFNIWILGLLIAGEGFHNNHHEQPGNPNMSHHWWQIDPAWYLIRLLAMCKLLTYKKIKRRRLLTS